MEEEYRMPSKLWRTLPRKSTQEAQSPGAGGSFNDVEAQEKLSFIFLDHRRVSGYGIPRISGQYQYLLTAAVASMVYRFLPCEEGFWRMRAVLAQGVYKPLSATRKKTMMQKRHEGKRLRRKRFSVKALAVFFLPRETRDGAADVVSAIESEAPDEESETAQGERAMDVN
ncbi:hypothetical protein Cadr_000019286, partial [Camelus dromedarius]